MPKGSLKILAMVIINLALLVAPLVGCSLLGSRDKEPGVDRVPGGQMVFGMTGNPSLLNPLMTEDSQSGFLNSLIYGSLVRHNHQLEIEGYLARDWEVSEDRLIWVFHLREDVRWHDGEAFTAHDVVFTYQTLLHPDYPGQGQEDFLDVKEVRATGDFQVEFHLERPFSPLLSLLTLGILPEHLFSQEAPQGTSIADLGENPANHRPVGLGPYTLDSWDREEIILERNPEFFLEGPWIQTLSFRLFDSQDALLDALAASELDYAASVPPSRAAQLAGLLDDSFEMHQQPTHGYQYIGLRHDHPLLGEVRVRKALMAGMNREAMLGEIFGGYATPVHSHYLPTSWGYSAQLDPYEYDPERAEGLLREAGLLRQAGGLWKTDRGDPLSFDLVAADHSQETRAVLSYISQRWLDMGVEMNPQYLEWSVLLESHVERGSFEAYLLGWTLGLDPDAYVFFHSSQKELTPDGYVAGLNDVGFSSEKVDSLLEEGRWLTDADDRRRTYTELAEILNQELPYLFLYSRDTVTAVNTRVKGVLLSPLGPVMPETWYIKSDS